MKDSQQDDPLTSGQKATLGPYLDAFRNGDRTKRSEIVIKLAKTMYKPDDPPLVQTRYYKAIKDWFFNRGRKPEKIEVFRHRGYSAQEVYNRAFRSEISDATLKAMKAGTNVDDLGEEGDEEEVEGDERVAGIAPAFVGLRQKMLSKMFADLPAEKREEYKQIAEKWTNTRAPRDMILRRAKRYTAAYTKAFAGQMYKDLGVRVIVFTMQKGEDDDIKVGFHDYNGYYDGATTLTAERPMWQKKRILDELDEYAQVLFESDEGDSATDAPPGPSKPKALTLEYENGYPKVPDANSKSLTHKDMSRFLREFLTFHYHRASGIFKGPIPWNDIVKRSNDFIDAEYLPADFTFVEPDHLRVRECAVFMKHLLARQKTHGVGPEVFAWKCFAQKQKGGGVLAVPAMISFNDVDNTSGNLQPPPKRPRPKSKGKRRAKTSNLDVPSSDSGMDTPPDCDWLAVDTYIYRKDTSDSEEDDEPRGARVSGGSGAHLTKEITDKRQRGDKGADAHIDISEPEDSSEQEIVTRKKPRAREGRRNVINSDEEESETPPIRNASANPHTVIDPHTSSSSGKTTGAENARQPAIAREPIDTGAVSRESRLPVKDRQPDAAEEKIGEPAAKPQKRRREEVDARLVINEPRVRKNSQRIKDIEQATTPVQDLPAKKQRSTVARQPANQKKAGGDKKGPTKKGTRSAPIKR